MKNKDGIFYTNIILIFIIIVNVIALSLKFSTKKEPFENAAPGKILVETRPCTLHLTEDDEVCDKLSDFYKLSELQLQVVLNKLKLENKKDTYDLVKYVKDNKKTLPIHTCKIELEKFREVKNLYGSSNINIYKNMFRDITYDTNNLFGYCLTDISSYSEFNVSNILNILKPSVSSNIFVAPTLDNTISNIEDSVGSKYLALKVKNKIDPVSFFKETGQICKSADVTLEDNLNFIRLHCKLLNDINLKIDRLETVSYVKKDRNFRVTDDGSYAIYSNLDLNKLFSYFYDKKTVMYKPVSRDVYIYKITYDYCDKIESYKLFENVKMSLDELQILPKVIKNNVDLSPYLAHSNMADDKLPIALNMKIADVLKSNKNIEQTLVEYTSNQATLTAEYSKLNLETCPSIVSDNNAKAMCIIRATAVQDEYNKLDIEKYYLKELLEKQRIEYNNLLDAANKLRLAKYTVMEVNKTITTGMAVSYSKYSEMISNDDYLYIQI